MYPFFEELSVDEMLAWVDDSKDVWNYFPELKEVDRLPRQYIINMIHSVMGEPFAKWVKEKVDARNKKLTESRDLLINMDPAIAELLKKSTHVSCRYATCATYVVY